METTIRIEAAGANRVYSVKESEGTTGTRVLSVDLPVFEKGLYFAARQKHDAFYDKEESWHDGYNRLNALPVSGPGCLKEGGLFFLLQTEGRYLALLPISGQSHISWLCGGENGLTLKIGNMGSKPLSGEYPVLAVACSETAYEATRSVWQAALAHPAICYSARMRSDKTYPYIFKYLGWCSWEQYKTDINSKLLCAVADKIGNSPLPIRYMLIDDGHLSTDKTGRALASFLPDGVKFPEGFTALLSKKSQDKIRWMGIWLCFNGYWNGIAAENSLGSQNEHLRRVASDVLMPGGEYPSSVAFYDGMISQKRWEGFDFVKVDVQARNLKFYSGDDEPAVCAANNSRALESVCANRMDGLINCMAHSPVCFFHTAQSVVTRCSEDYVMGDEASARRHLYNSYANMLYLAPTVWGDHDMFHSGDPVCGRMMAVSKAMSGGPVYLSDAPEDFVLQHVLPLCYDDGELLRPLAPAAPTRQSLFTDPYTDGKPFVVGAPLVNKAVAIAVYNLTEPVVSVAGEISKDDYRSAAGMLDCRLHVGVPDEELVLYDWYAKTACRLDSARSFSLSAFEDKLFLLIPCSRGWAVIGDPGKYLSAAAVEIVYCSEERLLLKPGKSKRLLLWMEGGLPDGNGVVFHAAGTNLWEAFLPSLPEDGVVSVERS